MSVSRDRWSCPACNRTVVVDGSQADTQAAIHAVQERHARGHEAAAYVLEHLPLPDPPKPTTTTRRTPRRTTRKD